ncbi:hypothetical protein, unknown function [Leishmania donovani]|uniref:Uncharacterized protein n=1 Tax=Leishmania donovani TaxID=5661 RepID=E9BGY2_LEIDO|nr:hypothetical protein, unknown function [Leishmania donovani]TPP52246.1 hypothetical protein CGC21_16205 [Leishmania donovani]CBZ34508.1 hypothetical protein, unknown function [Leishmania donovani]
MNFSAAPKGTETTPSRVPLKGLTHLRRSRITHLSTPHYAQTAASASASSLLFTSTSSAAHPAARTFTSPSSRGHRTPGASAASTWDVQRAASARCASRFSSPQALGPYTGSVRSPAWHGRSRLALAAFGNGSGGGDTSSRAPWRHHVAAVCHRLQHTVQEAEQILVPATASAASAPSSTPLDQNSSGGLPCTLAQAMDALQRYRSGCMAAMLELDALQQQHGLSASSTPPPTGEAEDPTILCSPIQSVHGRTAHEEDDADTSPPSLTDAAQLYRRYHLIKAHLNDTVAAQSAYMQEITLQQQLREREGVMCEYMWTARLLVEQEAAERAHLVSLWAYLIASAPERPTASNARAGTGFKPTAAARMLHTLATAAPPPPEPAKLASYVAAAPLPQPPTHGDTAAARLAAQNESLLHDLHHSNERTYALLHEQQKGLQEAQERALAQLVARHDAEKSVLEARVRAAQEAAAQSQHRLTEVKQALAAAQSATCEMQRCAGLTYDGMHQQLKDTTKKMWQLQLANDHLDAKARVLERELEELRLSPSSVRNGQGGNGTASSAAEQASGLASLSAAGAAYSSNGCARNDGGSRTGSVTNVRHGQPPASSRRASAQRAAGGGRRGGKAQSVSPGVWCAYEERSGLLTSATPVKQLSLGSSLSSGHALAATRWTQELQHGNAHPRSPFIRMAHSHGSSLLVVSANSTTTDTDENASNMNEHDAAYAPTSNTNQWRPPSVTGKVGDDDKDSISSSRHRLFERTLSPARQLSLDRTPAQQSSVAAAAYPLCVEASEIDSERDSVAHSDPSRAQPNAARHCSSASAQTNAAESLRSATPRLGGVPATSSGRLQAPSDTAYDGGHPPPLTVPHDMDNLTNGERATAKSAAAVAEGEEVELQPSLASVCSSPIASGSLARLEAVRRDILRHAERLEREVQVVTSRHDAARRQRRRERDTLRVNASIHSGSNSPATSEPRNDEGRDTGVGHADDADSEALNRALEELHIEQQEDDDELERFYAHVNQKRMELERCLRSVEDRLASLL